MLIVVCRVLFVARCPWFVVCYLFVGVRCLSLVARRLLLVGCCSWLFVARCVLLVVRGLFVVRCLLFAANR